MTDAQIQRLGEAVKLHKYGNLETWQELFYYQVKCADAVQIREIADWAKKWRCGGVKLPLKLNTLKEYDTYEAAKEIFV